MGILAANEGFLLFILKENSRKPYVNVYHISVMPLLKII